MAKITNSFVPNRFGGGYEQTITTDSGSSYTVRNTFVPNRFGGGYEQEIVPSSEAYNDATALIPETKEEAFLMLRVFIWLASMLVGVVSILMNWMDGWKCIPLWWSTGISAVVFIISYISTLPKNNN